MSVPELRVSINGASSLQSLARQADGREVRIELVDCHEVSGTLMGVGSDCLIVKTPKLTLVPFTKIITLEIE